MPAQLQETQHRSLLHKSRRKHHLCGWQNTQGVLVSGLIQYEFIGFKWDQTCAETQCGRYGACCSSSRDYFTQQVTWVCLPGAQLDSASEKCVMGEGEFKWTMGEFLQGTTCPTALSCNAHRGACCYMIGTDRVCADNTTRKACSSKPGYVAFHTGATCTSIGNCSTTAFGACVSPPSPERRTRRHGAALLGRVRRCATKATSTDSGMHSMPPAILALVTTAQGLALTAS
jgi:hypothetical protein